jgi:hypothetical protein
VGATLCEMCDRLAPQLCSSRLVQLGHGGAEAEQIGDGGEIYKILRMVPYKAHGRQVNETAETLSEGPGRF